MRDRAEGARRLLRGLRARRWSSLALFLTGLLTVAAATLGPLYARAAGETVLTDTLTAATPSQTGVHLQTATDLTDTAALDAPVARAPAAGFDRAYPTRVVGVRADAMVNAAGGGEPAQTTRMVWRQGFCAHLVFVSGRCPTGAGEAAISSRTLDGGYGYRLDGTVRAATDLTVVGVYRPRDVDDPFWFDRRYFNAAKSYADGRGDIVDAVFVDRSTIPLLGTPATVDVDYPLDADRVHLSDLAALTRTVDRTIAAATVDGTTADVALATTLRGVDRDRADVGEGSLLVSLQLAALALFVLFTVTSDALDGRGGDVALAKLRGWGPGATVGFLLGETVLLLALAVPAGAAVGLLTAHLLAGIVLLPGVPVVFPGAAAVAAGAAFVGALVAAGLAARRVVVRTVLDQWRGARRNVGRNRRALVADLVVAALAVVGVVLLALGRGGGVALLAPGLLVLAVGLLGLRLVPLALRAALPRTAAGPRLGRFLAVRQVARRPAALRLAVLLAVATGLAVFGVGGETIAAGNRTARAHVEVGAPRTVAVQFPTGADPSAMTATVDPDGAWAMTAATWLPAGGTTVTGAVEGVDPARFARVAFPTVDGPSTTQIARGLDPDPVDPVDVVGTRLAVTLTASGLSGEAPQVQVVLGARAGERERITLGTLRAGKRTYSGAVPCVDGCRLAGFGWTRPVSSFDPIGGTVLVQALTVTRDGASAPVDLRLDQPAGWRPRSPDATDSATTNRVSVTAGGVLDTFTAEGGASAGLAHADGPSPLPLWASSGAIITPPPQAGGAPGVPQVIDTFGNGFPVQVAGTTAALPGVRPGGVLADLSSLRDQLPGFTGEARWSVWLGADAPADAVDRLRAAGFDVGTVTDAATRQARLGRQGPALALALLLACALAAAVLATGATATAVAASGRRRSFELAALRVLGVPRRALTRSTVLEQALLLGSATVCGVPAGLLAAVVAMPVIPQFSDVSPLPLANTPQPLPVLAVVGAFVVLLVATAVLAGVLLVRAAVPARLRETGQ